MASAPTRPLPASDAAAVQPRGWAGLRVTAVCVLAAACAACGSGSATHGTTSTSPPIRYKANLSKTLTATSGGLTLTLTVTPTRAAPGATVRFTISLRDPNAAGALGYQLEFGDGDNRQSVTPQFCRSLPRPTVRETWTLHHRYRYPGFYHASVDGYTNCSPTRVAGTINVTIA